MQRKRFVRWAFGVLVGGVLLLPGVVLGPLSAQEEPPGFPESIQGFGPGGRTLGGPGTFTGKCNGITRTIFTINDPQRLLCATVENTGQCRVVLRLARLYPFERSLKARRQAV